MDRCRLGSHPAVFDTFRADLLDHEGKTWGIWLQSKAEAASFHSYAYAWSRSTFWPAYVC